MTCDVALPVEYEDCLVGASPMSIEPVSVALQDRKLVYVAGYYTANPVHGTRNAVSWAEKLLEAGWLPFVPHTSLLYDAIAPHDEDWWYAYDLGLLLRCDAMFICPDVLTDKSTGVAAEIRFAVNHDIPIFHEVMSPDEVYGR